MDEHERTDADADADEQSFVRALLEEAGSSPDPLPDDVRERLDETLTGLVAERSRATPDPPDVVPLDRRRRRRVQVLAAAAAVVVGGYAATTSGLLQGVGDQQADSATAGGGLEAAPGGGGAASDDGSFPLASGSLREDARALVEADPLDYRTREDSAVPSLPEVGDGVEAPAPQPAAGATVDQELDARGGARRSGCVDPLAPTGLPRLSATYDGAAVTAVLRPLRPAPDGTPRVRVEVWDCSAPLRLAAVVVRR